MAAVMPTKSSVAESVPGSAPALRQAARFSVPVPVKVLGSVLLLVLVIIKIDVTALVSNWPAATSRCSFWRSLWPLLPG